ncbi:hypothetical protein QNH48_28760 [Neobacillus sp. YX16]|uniref:hypothetical protein n=1 Tax=Neobacillus sp. YX16 TaxID=3047874 RepID=UPI0024C40808|nr:hypothetical protein [Neobacillus sp. YX16]WHZ02864.1 hypothetical protein QNH48_28760 [Neobacillus sp. YX16]
MKKYWILTAGVVVVVGTTLLLVMNKDKKETASGGQKTEETVQRTSSGGKIVADQAANTANPKVDIEGTPLNQKASAVVEKQEEMIEDIKKMYKPEWDKVNQIAEKRLTELIAQAQKEYKAKKERNQDVSRLEGKYLTIYNDYEESTKTQVDGIISTMQKEIIEKEIHNNIGDEYFEIYRFQKEKRIAKVVSELKKLS